MKTAIYLFILLLTEPLAAIVPQYQISSIHERRIDFSNGAVLDAYIKDFMILQGWDAGDSVEIVSVNFSLFGANQISRVGDHLVISPLFLMRNLTRGNEQISVWLREPPTVPNQDTYSVLAIDLINQVVTLSDLTVWSYTNEDQFRVLRWKVGDIIMIGTNIPLSPSSGLGLVLFNSSQQSFVGMTQQ